MFLFGPLFLYIYIYYVYNFFLSPFFLLFHIYLYFVSCFREKSLVYMTFSMEKCTMCFFFFFSQQIVTYFVTCILFYFCCIKKQFEHLSLSVCERLFFSLRLTLDKSPCKIVLWTRSMHPLHLWNNWNFVFFCCCCYFFRLINCVAKKNYIFHWRRDYYVKLWQNEKPFLFSFVVFFDAGKYTRGGANIAKITL